MCSAARRWPRPRRRGPPASEGGREDWRKLPLVTIDPADAKDHDDAVHADARHRSEQCRRLHRHGRDRRRRALRDARLGARPRGAGARQLGLFPRPRRADAARAHLQRSVLAAPERGPRRARRAHGDRRRRAQAQPHLPSRADALGREAALRAGAGRRRRPHRRDDRPPARPGDPAAVRRLRGGRNASATSASRSTSTCPSARSC